MGSLREIKDRIGSVRSTLKITSAMKLVASAKLHKAQQTIEGMRPYEKALSEILATAVASCNVVPQSSLSVDEDVKKSPKTAFVVIASNSSLCGAFNNNVLKKAAKLIADCEGEFDVFAIGRKAVEATRRGGFPLQGDFNNLVAHPSYAEASALAEKLAEGYFSGVYSSVILVYNHFVSTAKQLVVEEQYLPFDPAVAATTPVKVDDLMIMEPSPEELVKDLSPKVLLLKFYAAILDSVAAEHAARTVAMQTATDNAEELLGDLTMEYNKGRQQKITAEILDLLGGTA